MADHGNPEWARYLSQVFGAYVGQASHEEAAEELSDQFTYDFELRDGVMGALREAINPVEGQLPLVIAAINESGIRVESRAEAMHVLDVFTDHLRAACGRAGVNWTATG